MGSGIAKNSATNCFFFILRGCEFIRVVVRSANERSFTLLREGRTFKRPGRVEASVPSPGLRGLRARLARLARLSRRESDFMPESRTPVYFRCWPINSQPLRERIVRGRSFAERTTTLIQPRSKRRYVLLTCAAFARFFLRN